MRSITSVTIAMFLMIGVVGFAEAQEKSNIDPYREFVQANKLASAGALTRSIPHYENVLRVAGDRYPLAHFNLAEVLRHKKECAQATVLYRAYLAQGKEEDVLKEADSAIRDCKGGAKWSKLTVRTTPEEATIRMNGYVIGRGKALDNVVFAPGEYVIEVEMEDHHSRSEKITLVEDEAFAVDIALKAQTFHGSVQLKVEQSDVTIRLHPREQESTEVIEIQGGMTGPLRLVSGKYFVEVIKPDHHRWIRNIEVGRDVNTEISVNLKRELPSEIR